ncbi:MAG: exosortase/archaeosortase family protein [Planctomycetota bacterium]|jgi:exosortase
MADKESITDKRLLKSGNKQSSVENNQSSRAAQSSYFAGAPRTNWRDLGVHNYVKMLIIGGLFVYLFHKEIGELVRIWLNDRSWSHGFLIPLFSLYFINQHKKEILSLQIKPSYWGLFFLICGILFYFFNIASPSGYAYFRYISMIAALGAVVLFLGGWRLIRYTWLPVAFLVFAVRVPVRYYVKLTMPLQRLAATVASPFLNLVPGMNTTVHGVVIEGFYKGQPIGLNVEEACSGMRLLMVFLALGVAMAYLHYRPIWQRIILLASTIPIAIFCNIVRVTILGLVCVFKGPQYVQEGIYHDMPGYIVLLLAFGLYGSLAWFMSSLFVEESAIGAPKEDIVVRKRGT